MQANEILERFEFYRNAPEALHHEILESAELVTLPVGFHPFQEGSGCPGVAFVGAGDVRVFKVSREGREITLYHVGPGETCLLTLNAALGNSSYPASAVVEAPVEAVAVPADSFRAWVRRDDSMRVFVFEQMAYRISNLMVLIHDVVFRRMDRRVAEFLLSRQAEQEPDVPVEVTHNAIATEMGSAREVVSRVLKELEREGAVALGRGHIEIVDQSLLHRLAKPQA
ncbi:MAG: Crp/Fnr family transcriptional regulator [Thermoanaerobaculia bacterium]